MAQNKEQSEQQEQRRREFIESEINSPQFRSDLTSDEAREQFERAEAYSKVLINHVANKRGEILAHVEENPAFQEIYDYKGGQQYQHRLDRKREEVSYNYSSRANLFQKVYYATGLTAKDER